MLRRLIAITLCCLLLAQPAYAWKRFGGGYKQQVSASDIETDTTNFSGNLTSSDTDVQKVIDKFDDFVASGGGYATVQDEGSALTQRTKLNFIGAGVSCADDAGNTRTNCTITSGGGTGDVVGPASATDNALVRFDSTTGKLIQDSGAILSDANALSGVATLDTGQGANELYAMDQNVLTTSAPTFAGATLTGDFIVDTSDFVVDVSTNFVGVGDATPDFRLDADDGTTTVSAAATYYPFFFTGIGNSSADNSGSYRGLFSNPHWSGTSSIGTFAGLYTIAENDGTNATGINHFFGNVGRAFNNSSGNATYVFGDYADFKNVGAGTLTHAGSFYAAGGNVVTAGTVTNAYGLKVDAYTDSGTGSITNNYGIQIASIPNSNDGSNNNISLMVGSAPTGPITAGLYVNQQDAYLATGDVTHTHSTVSSSSGTDSMYSLSAQRNSGNTGTTGDFIGFNVDNSSLDGSGTVGSVVGYESRVTAGNAHTVTSLSGFESTIRTTHASAVATSGYGYRVNNISNTGTFTNLYGVHVGDLTTGTQTNTPYSFYASDANTLNYLAGSLGLGDTSPAAMLTVGSGDLFQVDSSGIMRVATGSAPTTDAEAEVAFDNNAWAASRGALQVYDGTASTFVVAALASDAPSNGQVLQWNTGGTITWESLSAGAVNWDAIGDPTADGTIALAGFETDFTSTLDSVGKAVWTITNTDADTAADTDFISLAHNDGADANIFYFRAVGDLDGTPQTDYLFSQTAALIRPDLTVTGDLTITGDDLFMTTNTSGSILVADGTNFNPVVMSGDVAVGTTGTATIQADSVALTTDTTGNYVTSIVAGTAIDAGAAAEGGTPTVDWDSTEVEATTWGAGGNASNAWTYNLSGTDPLLVAVSGGFRMENTLQLGVAGTDGQLKIFSEDGATDHSTIFNPGVQTQDVTYTLPVDDGGVDQFLKTDGSGILSWASPAGSGDVTDVGNCGSGACFTGTTGTTLTSTTSEILDLGTANTLIYQRNDAGSVSFMGKDNADPADTIYDTSGAGAITVGSADVTSVTVTTDGTGTGEVVLPDESIGAAEIANASITTTDISGSAGITAAQTALTAGRSLTLSTNDILADAELYTDTKTIYFESPVAADDFKTIWTAPVAATITKISCESDQTVNFDLQVDDGSPTGVNGSDIACTTFATDSSLAGDTTMAAGDRLDLAVTSVSGTPTWVSISWEFTYDD